jgi:ribulose 1,5-bisphosphate synthetase/thiazole synthase
MRIGKSFTKYDLSQILKSLSLSINRNSEIVNTIWAIEKVVVIGGGAAGFFCAVTAARLNPDLQVLLLEKTTKLLSKVKISGGGRCNVTHALFDIEELSKRTRAASIL